MSDWKERTGVNAGKSAELIEARQQRDALAEALEDVLDYADRHVLWPSEVRQKARAALAQYDENGEPIS